MGKRCRRDPGKRGQEMGRAHQALQSLNFFLFGYAIYPPFIYSKVIYKIFVTLHFDKCIIFFLTYFPVFKTVYVWCQSIYG